MFGLGGNPVQEAAGLDLSQIQLQLHPISHAWRRRLTRLICAPISRAFVNPGDLFQRLSEQLPSSVSLEYVDLDGYHYNFDRGDHKRTELFTNEPHCNSDETVFELDILPPQSTLRSSQRLKILTLTDVCLVGLTVAGPFARDVDAAPTLGHLQWMLYYPLRLSRISFGMIR